MKYIKIVESAKKGELAEKAGKIDREGGGGTFACDFWWGRAIIINPVGVQQIK
jgi:hypothetical protein